MLILLLFIPVYLFCAFYTAETKRRCILSDQHDFLAPGGDVRPFFCGLFWPIVLIKWTAEDLVDND